MEIRSICVSDHRAGGFWNSGTSSLIERKSLPLLSVVQSVRGSYRISLDDDPVQETGPMGVFVAPRHVTQSIYHQPDTDGTMDAQWVFLDVEINRLYKLDDLYTFPTVLPHVYDEEIGQLLRTVANEPRFLSRLPALHRLVEILLENATPKPRIPEDVARLRNYIEDHYMHPITPEDLMQVLHCSRSALYRRFREDFGESPSHYINRVRIRHAQLLLISPDESVGEIAAAVGIPDVHYFARLFRRLTGESARDFRDRRDASEPDGGVS